jgi:copper oxidase (laccase) domain-containing protein
VALKICVSTVEDGNMKSIHDGDINGANESRKKFLIKNSINPQNTTLVQLKYEGDDYRRYFAVNDSYKGDGIVRESTIVSDALVASVNNHALFLPLADCIGVVLYDPTKNVLMLSHSGRHNLEQLGGVASVNYLVDNFNIDPASLKVWLSPAAGKNAYPLFAFDNRSMHDVAVEQFNNAGVLSKNVEVSPVDSAMDANYYSHSQFLKGNRSSDGRFAVVACLMG